MKTYTVKEVAKLAGVSVRTLHHYHDIGLLTPALIGENRYRYYGEAELLRLQQILFYREFGLPLAEIADLLDQPGFDHVAALQTHREEMIREAERYRQLIRTIDRTIAQLTGDSAMKVEDLYKGFSPEKQAEYEEWLIANCDGDMAGHIADSKKSFAAMSAEEQAAAMAELAEVEKGLSQGLQHGVPADSAALDPLLSRHRSWVALMWGRDCPLEAYAGLAEMYLSHPDFRKRYETLAEGFTDYLTSAMKAYVARQAGEA